MQMTPDEDDAPDPFIPSGDKPARNTLDYGLWAKAVSEQPPKPIYEHALRAWIEGPVRDFFPFKRYVIGYGEYAAGAINVKRRLIGGYRPEWIRALAPTLSPADHNSFNHWIRERQPCKFETANPPAFASKDEIEDARKFSLGRVAFHGVVDWSAGSGSYQVFSGLPKFAYNQSREALLLIAPVLHALLLETVGAPDRWLVDTSKLTARQTQIATLAAEGKDDKTIADALEISPETVANHLRVVFKALGVRKRGDLRPLLRPAA